MAVALTEVLAFIVETLDATTVDVFVVAVGAALVGVVALVFVLVVELAEVRIN